MVVSILALTVALGGTSYAAIALPANSVGSKQIKPSGVKGSDLARNAVTSPKVKDGSLLSADFKPGQLEAGARGATGSQGPQGLKGDKGDPGTNGTNGTNGTTGAPATKYFARIAATGSLINGSTGASSTRDASGYHVRFAGVTNFTTCAVMALPESDGGPPGELRRSTAANSDEVLIRHYDSGGAATPDYAFNIVVFC